MPETVLERHYRDRLHSLRNMTSGEEGAVGLAEPSFQDVVSLCRELSEAGRDLLEKEWQRLFHRENLTVGWLVERRHILEALSEEYVRLAQSIRDLVAQQTSIAAQATLPDQLDDAIQALVQVKQDVLSRWPVGSDEEIAQAQASASKGQESNAEEAFARIAGVDVEAWRKRVEDYKRGRHG
jgi:hypothetical protein